MGKQTNILSRGVDLASDEAGALEVVLAPGAAEVKGSVKDSDGLSIARATVMVWPLADRPDLFRTVVSDENGQFIASSLAPGDYDLLAFTDLETGGRAYDSGLRKYFSSKRVTVALDSGGQRSVQLLTIGSEAMADYERATGR